jgi:hypothetical protein
MKSKSYVIVESGNIYTFKVCDESGKVFEYPNLDCDLIEHYTRVHEQLGYTKDKTKKKTYRLHCGNLNEDSNSYKFSLCDHEGEVIHYDNLSKDQYSHLIRIHETAGYRYSADVPKKDKLNENL